MEWLSGGVLEVLSCIYVDLYMCGFGKWWRCICVELYSCWLCSCIVVYVWMCICVELYNRGVVEVRRCICMELYKCGVV